MASFPPPVDVSTLDHFVRAADNSATNWYSFVGSLHRVLGSAYVLPFRLLDIMLGLPEGDLGDPPPHPDDPPPLIPHPGEEPPPPMVPVGTSTRAATAEVEQLFLTQRREFLVLHTDYLIALEEHERSATLRTQHAATAAAYAADSARFAEHRRAWLEADSRATGALLLAIPSALMRNFQARRIGSRQIWLELEAMFERTDFDAVGPLFKEYFSITIEHSAGAVDYTSRLLDLASRLEARQTTLPPNLQIYRLLEGLSPQYEVHVIAFTEAQPRASLDTVVQWIIDAEARLLSTPPSGLNSTESQNPQLAGG
ncbi:hypothetical protein CLOM_g3528 [Closterium sp. NIES-68]|nr:hypothetical protein CLOM_g3528 [Closterium sp. NIES-68]GJP69796.1 hypothetical protein CLOP_g813 [Closterium sp. NIES-67]